MPSLNELRDERSKLASEMKEMATSAANDKRDFSAEENEKFEKIDKDQEKLRSLIERLEKTENLDHELQQVVSTGIGREQKIEAKSYTKPEERQLNAFRSYLLHGEKGMVASELSELRAIGSNAAGSATLTSGGYVAPALPTEQLEKILRDLSGVLSAPVRTYPTVSGNTIPWPTVNDTANSVDAIDENPASDASDASDPTFGVVNIGAYAYTSGVLPVSRQWLQDSIIPAEQLVNELLGERLAATINGKLTNGNGTTEPEGITVGASNSGITVDVSAFSTNTSGAAYKKLQDIIHSVAPQYRRSPSFGLMFGDSFLLELKKLVDGQGRPLWTAGMAAGEPDRVCNTPYYLNTDMGGFASPHGDVPLVVGDFSKFIVRTVRQAEYVRLDELLAKKLQIGFMVWYRLDSKVINDSAIKYVVSE